MDVFKERPVLENGTASNEFTQCLRVRASKFGADSENCFGFSSKIDRVIRFVVVEPVHAVAVVEKRRAPEFLIDQEPVEPSIQLPQKR